MEPFGIKVELKQKGYSIELVNHLDIGIDMNLIGNYNKNHGSMYLNMEDIDRLIEGLQFMKLEMYNKCRRLD